MFPSYFPTNYKRILLINFNLPKIVEIYNNTLILTHFKIDCQVNFKKNKRNFQKILKNLLKTLDFLFFI